MIEQLVVSATAITNKAVAALVPFLVPMDGGITINYNSDDVSARVKKFTGSLSANVLWICGWVFIVLIIAGIIRAATGNKGGGIAMAVLSLLGALFCFWPDTIVWLILIVKDSFKV